MTSMTNAVLDPPAAAAAARRDGLALAVLLLGQFMAILDVNIVNVALPTLRADLHTSDSGLQLIVAGYVLTFAVLLITGARLGGLVGHRRIFLLGLAVFTAASLACGLAPQVTTLVIFRLIQGVGAALMTPQIMSLIQHRFHGPARARALGLYTAVVAGGVVVGQVVGGLLVSADLFGSGWRSVFLVNVPIGVLLLILAPRALDADPGRRDIGLDLWGLAVVTPAVTLFVLPLILGDSQGWPVWCAISLAASLVLFAGFVLVEWRVAARGGRPLLSPRVLRAPGLVPAALTLLFAPGSWGAFLFTTTLHLQGDLEMNALHSGLAFVPSVATFAFVSLTWRHLPARVHPYLVPGGLALAALSYVWIGPLAGGGAGYELLTALIGLGLGVMPVIMTLALAHVAVEDASDASGLLLTIMQLGQVIGVATIGSLFVSLAQDGHSTRHAEYGTGWALAVAALLGAASGLLLLRSRTASRPVNELKHQARRRAARVE
jgi:MFS family permease